MRHFDQQELADGEVTGDEVSTHVFPILFRIYRYPRFARRITKASSPVSMAAQRRHAVVLRPSLAMAWLGKRVYGSYEP